MRLSGHSHPHLRAPPIAWRCRCFASFSLFLECIAMTTASESANQIEWTVLNRRLLPQSWRDLSCISNTLSGYPTPRIRLQLKNKTQFCSLLYTSSGHPTLCNIANVPHKQKDALEGDSQLENLLTGLAKLLIKLYPCKALSVLDDRRRFAPILSFSFTPSLHPAIDQKYLRV